jgi:hypothetical protein
MKLPKIEYKIEEIDDTYVKIYINFFNIKYAINNYYQIANTPSKLFGLVNLTL